MLQTGSTGSPFEDDWQPLYQAAVIFVWSSDDERGLHADCEE